MSTILFCDLCTYWKIFPLIQCMFFNLISQRRETYYLWTWCLLYIFGLWNLAFESCDTMYPCSWIPGHALFNSYLLEQVLFHIPNWGAKDFCFFLLGFNYISCRFCLEGNFVILVDSHFHPQSVFIWGTKNMLCLGVAEEVATFFKPLGACDPISYAFYVPFAMSLQVLERAVVSAHSSAKVNLRRRS